MFNPHLLCQICKIYKKMLDFIAGCIHWYNLAAEERPAPEQYWTPAHCSDIYQ